MIESQCDIGVTGRNSREERECVKMITWSPGTFLFGTVLQISQIRPSALFMYFASSGIKYIIYYLLFYNKNYNTKKWPTSCTQNECTMSAIMIKKFINTSAYLCLVLYWCGLCCAGVHGVGLLAADHSLVLTAHRCFHSPSSSSLGTYFYFCDFAFPCIAPHLLYLSHTVS